MANPSFTDLYQLLGVSSDAATVEIERAFRRQALLVHPDKNRNPDSEDIMRQREELMKQLTNAKHVLLDPERRAKYDEQYEGAATDVDVMFLDGGSRLSERYRKLFAKGQQLSEKITLVNNLPELQSAVRAVITLVTNTDNDADSTSNWKEDNVLDDNEAVYGEIQEPQPGYVTKIKQHLYARDITAMAAYIMQQRCITEALFVCNELTVGKDVEQLPTPFRASLLVLRAARARLLNNLFEATALCNEAVALFPAETVYIAVFLILRENKFRERCVERLHNLLCSRTVLADSSSILNVPSTHMYDGYLEAGRALRAITRSEKYVAAQSVSDFEKAMLYLDLGMATVDWVVLVNCFLTAATYLVKEMKRSFSLPANRTFATCYAIWRILPEILGTVVGITDLRAHPITSEHFLEKAVGLLILAAELTTQCPRHVRSGTSVNLVSDHHIAIAEICTRKILQSCKIAPFAQSSLLCGSDMLYLNLVHKQFLENYLEQQLLHNPQHTLCNLWRYHLLELSFKGEGTGGKFEQRRTDCLLNAVEENKWNVAQVEDTLQWDYLLRDDNGFLDSNRRWLDIPGDQIVSVDGVVVNFKDGTFSPIINLCPYDEDGYYGGVLGWKDFSEVFNLGIDATMFSLEAPDVEMPYHAYQEMKFYPARLEGSNFLATMFHADYLLKMFTTGFEVSAEAPFSFRTTYEGLLQNLPTHLQRILRPLSDRRRSAGSGRVHRFWIEAEKIEYSAEEDEEGETVTYRFHETWMRVKKRLLRYDKNGNAVDDENDQESDTEDDLQDSDEEATRSVPKKEKSAEFLYAQDFTEWYDEIADHFPVFARLREMLKLAAINVIMKSMVTQKRQQRANLRPNPDELRPDVQRIRRDILEKYPRNTASEIQKVYNDTLRANGVTDSEVGAAQRRQVQTEIQEKLQEIDEQMLVSIVTQMAAAFFCPSSPEFTRNVTAWIDSSASDSSCRLAEARLLNQLASSICASRLNAVDKILAGPRAMGLDKIAAGMSDRTQAVSWSRPSPNYCTYVPAVYGMYDQATVYGGVNLQLNLKAVSEGGAGAFRNSSGGSNGGGRSGGGSSGRSGGGSNGSGGNGGSGSSGSGRRGAGSGNDGRGGSVDSDGVHGNSRNSKKVTHVYMVIPERSAWKRAKRARSEHTALGNNRYIGISSTGVQVRTYDGQLVSARGMQTANKLTRETGIKHVAVVIAVYGTRIEAMYHEACLLEKGRYDELFTNRNQDRRNPDNYSAGLPEETLARGERIRAQARRRARRP
ncbi:uncharacterized protein LOC129595073 [Paramacrobiotus metropolitanus]|uniref:uncharacterized protein LOC129595073 n=1 Tax=Paramacrobiotus metropolitanus TaxID=2943436 RepID=UPI002445C2A7|nr:uncharacterized protein LOC129595073 [Paramacrobiotus metropolitanus]